MAVVLVSVAVALMALAVVELAVVLAAAETVVLVLVRRACQFTHACLASCLFDPRLQMLVPSSRSVYMFPSNSLGSEYLNVVPQNPIPVSTFGRFKPMPSPSWACRRRAQMLTRIDFGDLKSGSNRRHAPVHLDVVAVPNFKLAELLFRLLARKPWNCLPSCGYEIGHFIVELH